MLSSAARISSTSQMLRSWVVFLGASTGTGLLMRMPHSTASRKELCSSWWTSWRVVPERVRFCCLGERSRRLPPTYCPQTLIERLWAEKGITALLVTHDVSEAVYLADRVILNEEGEITMDQSIELARPRERDQSFAYYEQKILDRVVHHKEEPRPDQYTI